MARTIPIIFLAGVLTGVIITTAIVLLIPQEQTAAGPTDTELVDELISQWTNERTENLFFAGERIASELTDARPGYFPDTVRSLARIVDSVYHVPKSVLLAQWALESRFGLNALGASNYFGHTFSAVKQYMPRPAYVLLREKVVTPQGNMSAGRVVRFAKYSGARECFETHGRYVSRSAIYRGAFDQNSPEKFAAELAKRYATDPEYGVKLVVIMRRYQL